MWLFTSNGFLSIVHKDCSEDELMVRARRKQDIESMFPKAKIVKSVGNDYLFRAVVKRSEVAGALVDYIVDLEYPNFKDSIPYSDKSYKNACSGVWHVMSKIQSVAPFASHFDVKGNFIV